MFNSISITLWIFYINNIISIWIRKICQRCSINSHTWPIKATSNMHWSVISANIKFTISYQINRSIQFTPMINVTCSVSNFISCFIHFIAHTSYIINDFSVFFYRPCLAGPTTTISTYYNILLISDNWLIRANKLGMFILYTFKLNASNSTISVNKLAIQSAFIRQV